MLALVLLFQTALLALIFYTLKNEKNLPSPSPATATLEETAQRILRDLEEKIGKLQSLLDQADSRIQAISELQASLRIAAWEKKQEATEIEPTGTEQRPEQPSSAECEGSSFAVPPQYLKAYHLLQEGKTLPEVAKETQIAKGEIQLILGLLSAQS